MLKFFLKIYYAVVFCYYKMIVPEFKKKYLKNLLEFCILCTE